ncbi:MULTISPECIES: amino acid aminotransferase [Reinekea]|jgi:aspartate/tyrosine/aromatic aminotransferase|uniref:Aminotransferase n=1 Tax=Reinekea forsetii TaxID=1336806 RepID=A0A2K8KXJ0_9GAMM|nr:MULTISPECIES: amino acid aminotransferase [Reinekea]ATX77316.1 aromatic amino acid aminotransferase [Reinekea forsetii]MDO7644005.1 aspartate/tyrosine/aromatic aminotransferase [Reinekea forsetii]
MFERVSKAPADPILGLTDTFNADPRPEKVNLGVGVFRNEDGLTPILKTVKIAEQRLLDSETTKSYLAISGDAEYGRQVQLLLFAPEHNIISNQLARTAQTPGGTGALRVAADFVARQLDVETIWVSNPTWGNHNSIFASANLSVKSYRYYDAETQSLDFAGMLEDLQQVRSNDVVVFHGCCHNPTGIDPTVEQWQQLASLAEKVGFIVLFDFAYQGFAVGVDEDAAGLRIFAEKVPELLVASSFSKNFGLYNERVGAFTLVASNRTVADDAFSQVKSIIRSNYSNPPAHGAKIVAAVLADPVLKQQWIDEVREMREHIWTLRLLLVEKLHALGVDRDFSFITTQKGMFSFTGLKPAQVTRLREEFAIYMVGTGRINVAGLSSKNIDSVCRAIATVL